MGDTDGRDGGDGAQRRKSPAQLQLEVMDFSDRFVASTWAAVDEILAVEQDPARRVAILTWKVRYSSSSMEIGSGADPRTSILDMAIFISAGKWALEEYWIPHIFGPEGARLRPVYAMLEERIWALVAEKLPTDQTQLLRDLISQWTRENPPSYEISGIRFRNLEGVRAEDFQSPRDARGLLAAVRAWLGEVNTSLLFGERVLFYLERTPRMLAQQTDLTLAQIGDSFPLTRVDPDFPALAGYVEALPARMLEELHLPLPGTGGEVPPVDGEEAAPVMDFVTTTLTDTRGLVAESTTLVSEATGLVGSAGELSSELTELLAQLDKLTLRLENTGVLAGESAINLADVAASLASLERTVAGLQTLVATNADGLSPAEHLLEESGRQINETVDRIFHRLLLVLGIVFLIGCTWIVLARILSKKSAGG